MKKSSAKTSAKKIRPLSTEIKTTLHNKRPTDFLTAASSSGETKYRQLIENLNEGIWVIDHNAVTTLVNPKMAAIIGRSEKEIVGKTLMSVFPKDEYARIQHALSKRKQGVREQREFTFTHKDGTHIHTVIETYPLLDDNGEYAGAVAAFTDVTSRHRSDEELKRRNEENLFLVEASAALAACSDEASVFSLISGHLLKLIPDSTLIVMKTSDDGAQSTLLDIAGIDSSILSFGKKILRFDPVGKQFDSMKGFAELFCKPRLHKFNGGLFELSMGNVPKFAARRIEKILGARGIFSIGIAEETEYFGYVHIFTKQEMLIVRPATIESFIHQCHLTISKIRSAVFIKEEMLRRRILFESAADGIVIVDEHRAVVEANKKFADMLGRTMDELRTMHTWDWDALYPTKELMVRNWPPLPQTAGRLVTKHRRKDGSVFDVEIDVNPFPWKEQRQLYCVVRDITERNVAEERLRESELRYKTLFENSGSAIVIINAEGRYLSVNKRAAENFGLEIENIEGRLMSDLFPARVTEKYLALNGQLLASGGLREYEDTFPMANGSRTFLITDQVLQDSTGKNYAIQSSSTDITDRYSAESELRQSRKRLERAESVASFGNWEFSLNEQMIHASDGAKKIYGFATNIIPLRSAQEIVLAEYRGAMNLALSDLVENGLPYSIEFKIRRVSDGEIRDIFSKAEYHKDSRKIFGVIHDITERKKAQEQLERNEQRYRNIVDNLHQAYYESNSKAVFTYCNPGFFIMSGYTEGELLNMVSFKMVAAEHRRRVIDTYVGMMTEKRTDLTIEFLIATREGKKFWVEQTSHFEFNDAGDFIKASHFVKDISERKQSQDRLMESEKRYRQITEAVTDYIYSVSMEGPVVSSTKHGPGCLAVTGYTQEDFDQNRFLWYNMVAPEDRTIVEEQLDALFEQNNSAPIEHRIFRKDGHMRWVRNTLVPRRNESGKIISYDGLIQDITERKDAELKLRSSEGRNRALVSSLPDIIFVHDKNGMFLDYHAPENIPLWFQPQYFIGRTFADIMPKEIADVVMPKFTAAFLMNEMQTYEYSAPDGDKTKFYEARIIAFEENKALNIIRDVTDRVRAENDLRTLNEDLESRVVQRTAQLTEANRELEAFSYSVSHDLRAPLRAIDSFSAMLLEENEEKFDDEGKRLISIIRTSIKKMDLLINGLLTLSRIGRSELHITTIDMNSLAHTLVNENLSEDQRARYTIRINDLPAVNGDESLIRQALNNILSNAVKYSAAVEHPVIEISGTILEDSAVYSVKDNGAGFDPSKATKLFGIFQRLHTDDQFKGLGVGLSIVQRIVQRHGGRVWADGKLNNGAIFSFSIPFEEE